MTMSDGINRERWRKEDRIEGSRIKKKRKRIKKKR